MGEVKRGQPWDAERLWGREADKDIFVIGTGTSLAGFDYGRIDGKVTIGLNDAPMISKRELSYHIWADTNLAKRYRGLIHQNMLILCDAKSRVELDKGTPRCTYLNRVYMYKKQSNVKNLKAADELFVQFTVASAGVCLAWKLGAKRIFLLGVDAFRTPKAYYADGATHRSGTTRKFKQIDKDTCIEDRHERWIREQQALRDWFTAKQLYAGPFPESGVYNLTPKSQITAWEKVPIGEVL